MSTPHLRVKLTYPEALIKEPLLADIVRRFDVTPNIRRASVDETVGWIVCEISGEAAAVDQAVQHLRDAGVQVDLLGDVVES